MAEKYKVLYNIRLHLIIGTANRLPLILPDNEKQLFAIVKECFHNQNFKVEAINGSKEHLHLLLQASPNWVISDAIDMALNESKNVINEALFPAHSFDWHTEYGVYSVSQSQVERLIDYIEKQKQVHSRKSFITEWKEFQNVHGINP
ncbi:MAG: transposase [Bacteroidales bacterium]|nr:transposase [Bacteroidales bacterium]